MGKDYTYSYVYIYTENCSHTDGYTPMYLQTYIERNNLLQCAFILCHKSSSKGLKCLWKRGAY